VLDVDLNVQLFSLVVWGTLVVENRPGASVFLRTTCISVKPGGRLLAGRPSPALTGTQSQRPPYVDSYPAGTLPYLGDGPFLGRLEILLSGDDLTAAPQCGGLSGRKFINEGHVALHGARPAMLWSVLRHTAAAGAWTLTVQGDAGWRADDVILLASTADDESETETRTLVAAQLVPAPGGGWDTEVGLDAPLAHAHHGETEVHNGHTLELRAEVGVISRPTIKLAGVDSLATGFKFKTMASTDEGMMLLARGRSVTEHISAISPLYLAPIPVSRLYLPDIPRYLPYISPTSPLHLPCISPASPLHLSCISPRAPLHLPYISPASPR
jgi:hypothetical protein